MNPVITNLGVMLVMMQVSRRLDMEDEFTVKCIRIAYIVSNLIIFGLYMYTRTIINKKRDLTTLKYMEQPSAFAADSEGKLITTTVHQYDLDQVNAAMKSALQGVGMMAFMHLYMKYTNPLIMQSVMPLKSAVEQKIVQIHLFNKPSTGDLKRPFKAPSMFGDLAGGAATDKKTVEAAETAGKGGIKEE